MIDRCQPPGHDTLGSTRDVPALTYRNSEDSAAVGPIESISHTLDECRTQIDEVLVQLDPAKLDVRDEVDHQVAIAGNAYLAARSKVTDARLDSGATVEVLQHGLDQLLCDLGRAYVEVDAAVKRGVNSGRW
jgi:hypothetical protein